MEKSHFLELLKKYLTGTTTIEEQQFLFDHYVRFESEPDVHALLGEEKKHELESHIESADWHPNAAAEHPVKAKPWYNWVLKFFIAATLVICIASIFLYNQKPKHVPAVAGIRHTNEHRFLRLADGSTVIVSAGSKLNYPSSFDNLPKREVYLEGKAYFDIKHNPAQPFIVHTGKIETTVLGTAFNVEAWPSDADITITVSRGKVSVRNEKSMLGTIVPDQQMIYNKRLASTLQKAVETQQYLSWKDADLWFDNVTVGEAAELLETRFNVKISFEDKQIESSRFSTILTLGESLTHVLSSICEFTGSKYAYNREKTRVIISNK